MGRRTYDPSVSSQPTVVVIDQWALVRLGIGTVARGVEFRIVGEAERASDGILTARNAGAEVVVLGLVSDMAQSDAVRESANLDPAPAVVVLVERPTREELAELFTAGAQGVIPRSSEGSAVADAIVRAAAGERVIAPSLLPAFVGMVDADRRPSATPSPNADAPPLTSREREVLRALAGGRSNREIADHLYVTEATVKTHLANLYSKLDARDRHDALARAVALGLLD